MNTASRTVSFASNSTAPPFGHCYLTIDTERQGPLASVNFNRVYLCGTEAGMEPGSVGRWIELFAAAA